MRKLFLSIALLIGVVTLWGQKKSISPEQATYNYQMYPQSLYYLQWLENSDNYVYLNNNQLIIKKAFDKSTQQTITFEALVKHYPTLRHIPAITYIDEQILVFNHENSYHLYDYQMQQPLQSIQMKAQSEHHQYHPLKQAVAYTIDNNLYVTTPQNHVAVTSFEDKNIVSGQSIHRSEFGINKGIFWSPKGNFIAFYQKDETYVSSYPLVDISTTPASLQSIKYPMAGQKSERAKVGIFDMQNHKTIYLDIDTTDEHYLTNLSWSPDESFILLAEVNRDQNQYELNQYNVTTGKKTKTFVTEYNPKWVEPEHQAVFLPNGKQFVWLSEKDGFMNAYLYDINGKKSKQLTHFKWVIQEILGFDAKSEHVFVSGTGNDPREKHTFKINLKTGKHTAITHQKGTHQVMFNSKGTYAIDQYNSLETPNNIGIIDLKKNTRSEIFNASNPIEDFAMGTIELLQIKANDNKTELYAKMIKPHDFDPNKKYPVLLYVYGGPHAQLVTNNWYETDPWMLAMASHHQYIIFTLDNRGSSNRGFEFESVIHRDLSQYTVQDQMTGVDYLKSLPYIDSNRIAVHGWSFGGFLAASLMLRYPGVFTTAVIGGAVTDWKYYEVMYGERYMGTPEQNPNGYAVTNVMNYLGSLKGKLLCIHGYVDDVVLPQHLLALKQEAVNKNKNIDTFFYPKHKHNVSGNDRKHLTKIIVEYIIKHNRSSVVL